MRELVEAVMATAELMGTNMSEPAAMMLIRDLVGYPDEQVLEALRRCRLEGVRQLTLSAILERLTDGRPSAAEAFSVLSRASEEDTIVVTEEAMQAYTPAVSALRADRDIRGARAEFTANYSRLVSEARAARRPVRWVVSEGWDASRRAEVIAQAVREGKISAEDYPHLLDAAGDIDQRLARLASRAAKRLSA